MTTTFTDTFEVSNATRLIFESFHGTTYVLAPSYDAARKMDLLSEFPDQSIKSVWNHYVDDTDGSFFACCVVDCFDPPVAIIRARSFESAYETFCDEFSAWMEVSETNADDYPEDEREYSASGVHIDTSGVHITPITLVRIDA